MFVIDEMETMLINKHGCPTDIAIRFSNYIWGMIINCDESDWFNVEKAWEVYDLLSMHRRKKIKTYDGLNRMYHSKVINILIHQNLKNKL